VSILRPQCDTRRRITMMHKHNIDQHSPEKSSAIMIHQRLGNDASRTTLTVKRNPVNEYAAQRRDAVPMSEHMVLSSGADNKYDPLLFRSRIVRVRRSVMCASRVDG
jgi:hypothetical protein